MRIVHGSVVLASIRGPREGWDAVFRKMAANMDDALLIPDSLHHAWDTEEWKC